MGPRSMRSIIFRGVFGQPLAAHSIALAPGMNPLHPPGQASVGIVLHERALFNRVVGEVSACDQIKRGIAAAKLLDIGQRLRQSAGSIPPFLIGT